MLVPLLLFVVASIAGPANPVFIKLATTEIPPLTYSAIRFSIAALLLFPFWYQQRQFLKKEDIVKLLPFSINMVLFSIGIQYASNIVNGVLYALSPVLTAFFAYFLIKEKISREHIFGLTAAIIGVLVLIHGSLETEDIRSFGTPLGNLLILAAASIWSIYPVGVRVLTKSYSSITMLFYTFALTAFLFIMLMPIEWFIRPVTVSQISFVTVGSLLGSIFIGSLIFHGFYQLLIKMTSAFTASFVQYGGVVASILFGIFLFDEHLTLQLFIGSALIITGVFLATTYSQLKKRN